MIKINDIVKYKTFMNHKGNFGRVKEIAEIKESTEKAREGQIIYKIIPFEGILTCCDVTKEDILEVYTKEEKRRG